MESCSGGPMLWSGRRGLSQVRNSFFAAQQFVKPCLGTLHGFEMRDLASVRKFTAYE